VVLELGVLRVLLWLDQLLIPNQQYTWAPWVWVWVWWLAS
jgi:hypothetical protein